MAVKRAYCACFRIRAEKFLAAGGAHFDAVH
jgi:hypothetical protein